MGPTCWMRGGLAAAGCALPLLLSPHSAFGADPLGPGKGPWAVEPAESHGLNKSALDDGKAFLFSSAKTRDCLLIVKDGAIVYEAYAGKQDAIHPGYSMTKTLGALLMGSAVQSGHLDIDADITKAYGVESPKPYRVTSRQIMSQALDGADGPGQKWKYDSLGREWIDHLPLVLANATGKQPLDIWKSEFQVPLGLSSGFSWTAGPAGQGSANKEFAFGSKGTCRDYARVGQLLLNKGKWADKQVVSADYVEQMSTPQTKYAPYANYSNTCYGLLTWLNENQDRTEYPGECYVPVDDLLPPGDVPPASPTDIFFLGGARGQIVMMIPETNTVVVTMGNTGGDLGAVHVQTLLTKAIWCMGFGNC